MTISAQDQQLLDQLEHSLDATPRPHVGATNRRWLTTGFVIGLALITTGIALDHAVGFGAAVFGFVVVTLCLGDVADLVARPWLGGQGRHLTFRRWSSF